MANIVTDKKSAIDQACQTANDFINIYYKKVDGNRQTLAKTYLDSATLSWNGNRIDGPQDIQKFYAETVPTTSHNINSYDAQPVFEQFVAGQKTVAVHVAGAVKFGNDNKVKPFQQNFLLTER